MGGASMLVLGMVAAAPAFAADAPATSSDDTVVVVTGQRAQLKTAQKIKKDSETVVDSITSTDIGALPDRSVSEALQRVVGVTLQRTDANRDPARLSGEGGAIFVRGLSYVSTLLNGREVFSAANGRTLGFEDVSADLMAGVDVYKATVADQIEGSLGGTVDLRTRLPFDSKKRVVAFTFDGNYGDLRKQTFWSGSLTYSDRWNTSIGEVGLLVNWSESNVGTRSNSLSVDRFDAQVGPDAGKQICLTGDKCVPKAAGFRTIDWTQKRDAFATALQWRPSDQLLFTLQYIDTKASPRSIENTTGMGDGNINTPNATYTYNSNGQFIKGVVDDMQILNDTRTGDDHKETSDTSLSFKYTPSEKLTISGQAQYVRSHAHIISFTVGSQAFGSAGISDLAIDLTGKLPTFNYYKSNYLVGGVVNSANAVTNPGLASADNYYYAFAMDHLEENSATDKTARLDAEYSFDSSWLKSLKVGVRSTDKHAITRQNGYNWGGVSQDAQWNGNTINKDGTVAKGEYFSFNDFFGGDAPEPSSWFPTEALATYSPASVASLAKAAEGLGGWGWVPFNGDFSNVGFGRADNVSSGIIDQTEKTTAGYSVLRFGAESFLGSGKAWDGNIGVRVVKTELNNGTGQTIFPSSIDTSTTHVDPSLSASAAKPYNDAITISNTGGGLKGVKFSNTYTDTLPSLNVRLHWTDQLQFRFAASKAIVRPDFSQMSPFTTLSISTTSVNSSPPVTITPPGGTPTTLKYFNSVSYTGTGGNPNLKPMRATAYDFSAEWYFAPTGSLTFAAFDKELTNYFMGATAPEQFTIGGITETYQVFRTRNGSKGRINGFELAYQQFYDFLPSFWSGFGVQANYTLVNNKGGTNTAVNLNDPVQAANATTTVLPLEGLSKNSYNLALMYEKYGISARLAYNWRSNYLLTTSAANVAAPVWSEDYGQADGSVLYTLNPQVKVGMQVTNLFKTRTYLKVGFPGFENRYNWFQTDQRVAFVVRGTF